MKINQSKIVLQSEVSLLKDRCCQLFDLPYNFNEWDDLYKIALEKLKSIVAIDNNQEFDSLFNKVDVSFLADDFDIFIIETMPTKIYKLNWGDLKILWSDIWCPPIQDALCYISQITK